MVQGKHEGHASPASRQRKFLKNNMQNISRSRHRREDVRNFVESKRLTPSRDRLGGIFRQEKGVASEETLPDQ
jgi:hypothetical protein